MKRIVTIMACALLVLACDSKPATDEVPATTAPTSATPEPAEQPESAAHDHEHPEAAAEMPADLKSGEQGFYGAKFTVIEAPITLASAIEQASNAKEPAKVKVEATVKSVCKKKGCWFTMAGDGVDADIRVKMKDYSFFVPKNSEGARVVAEGTLTQRVVPQDEAQHYADDAAKEGEPAQKIEGDQKAWEFTATAVELVAVES